MVFRLPKDAWTHSFRKEMKLLPTIHLAIGADHRGFLVKQKLIEQHVLADKIIVWHDCGAQSAERSDYPEFAQKLCKMILENSDKDPTAAPTRGILICGTGNGMAIAANRFRGIYAAVAWNAEVARRAREEDWANVLALPADYLDIDAIVEIVTAWLQVEPKTGRHRERVLAIDEFLPH